MPADVLALVMVDMLAMAIGGFAFYLGWTREAMGWYVMSTIIFIVAAVFSYGIPFYTSADNLTLISGANILLGGINLMFALISLLRGLFVAIESLKKTSHSGY